MHCAVAEPRRPMLKITKERVIPIEGVVGILVISTFSIVERFVKKVKLEKKKKRQKRRCSFL